MRWIVGELPSLSERLLAKAASVNRPDEAKKAINDALAELEREGVAPGLRLGETAPDFTLPNAVGDPVRLADRLAAGPVVLTFYRGTWCPYCNIELHAYQEALPAFRAEGAQIVAVSPQAPDDSLDMRDKHGLEFDVLSDLDQDVLTSYKVRFVFPAAALPYLLDGTAKALAKQQPDGDWSLPVPATFVLDPDGVVRARHATMAYRTRMEPAEALRVVREINEARRDGARQDEARR
ncbi:peroxiredoxin family protein [Actinomadura sp. KC06]|uniref:peroxiredoxin family protein n=1 Tax=Actinomadura sp. KC06 TaxID=2530369 RepID=UPI001A9D3049|nr:peroxiredoxin family protein [Actinomadura sp. KC06]